MSPPRHRSHGHDSELRQVLASLVVMYGSLERRVLMYCKDMLLSGAAGAEAGVPRKGASS